MHLLCLVGLSVLVVGLSGSTCTEEREVQVVVAVDITAPLIALGSDNTYEGETSIDLDDELNLDEILQDNDLESIDRVTVQSAFYRVTRPDAVASRVISGGVLVRQDAGVDQTLISYQSVLVADPAIVNWTSVPLGPGGVTVLNAALEVVRTGGSAVLTVTSSGTSTPVDQATSFDYEVRVRLNVVGTALVEIIEPL